MTRHKWTDLEDALLDKADREGATAEEIADRFGVTGDAVSSRLRRLRAMEPSIPITFDEPELPRERVDPALRQYVDANSSGISTRTSGEMAERILFVPDAHVPYVDEKAWAIMLGVAKAWRPDRIFVLGDLADFYSVSAHSKDPARRLNLKWEIAEVNRRLDELDAINATHRHFIEGNHEMRLRTHLAEHSPAMFDLIDVPGLFRLSERGWTYTPYGQAYKLGHLFVTHDEGACGETAHIKARSTFTGNCVIGHTHHMGVDYCGNARGEQHVGTSFGWLGDVASIDYRSRIKAMRWTHGFGIGRRYGDDVHLQACPIVNGRVSIDGIATRAA